MQEIIIEDKINIKDFIVINFKEYQDIEFYNLQIKLHIFKCNSDKILIILPGAGGSNSGYNNKYHKIANKLLDNNLSTTICLDNITPMGLSKQLIGIHKIETIIDEVLKNPLKYCNTIDPEIYLIGFSDGGSIVASLAFYFEKVKKILLISPSLLMGEYNIKTFLPKFKGEVFLIVGENDEVIGDNTANFFYENINYLEKKLEIIKDCDHNFTGEKNQEIFVNSILRLYD